MQERDCGAGGVGMFVLLPAVSGSCLRTVRSRTTWQDTAFVTGSVGVGADLSACLAFAESLAIVGGWSGPIYVLNGERDEELKFGSSARARLVRVPSRSGGIDFGSNMSKGGGKGGYLKTLMMELPAIKESTLVWHDCDTLVAQPDCVDAMLGPPLDFSQTSSGADIYISNTVNGECRRFLQTSKAPNKFQSSSGRCGSGIHVGTFIAHRTASAAIMKEWKRRIHREPHVIDFVLLWDAWHALNTSSAVHWWSHWWPGSGSPPRVAQLPARLQDNMWMHNRTRCINHVTAGRLSRKTKQNRAAIYPLYKSLCLSASKPMRYLRYQKDSEAPAEALRELDKKAGTCCELDKDQRKWKYYQPPSPSAQGRTVYIDLGANSGQELPAPLSHTSGLHADVEYHFEVDSRYTRLLTAKAEQLSEASALSGDATIGRARVPAHAHTGHGEVHVLAETAVWGCDGPLVMRFPPLINSSRVASGRNKKRQSSGAPPNNSSPATSAGAANEASGVRDNMQYPDADATALEDLGPSGPTYRRTLGSTTSASWRKEVVKAVNFVRFLSEHVRQEDNVIVKVPYASV
jgi:hypothetical protein